jgi:hypothetical protein
MRQVKLSNKHYINADLLLEVYPHLAEPGLTVVMAAPQADARGETESALLKIYTIDLHGEEAGHLARWLDEVAEDGLPHPSLPKSMQLAPSKEVSHEER